ncbi:hypothetical protein [uncultured Jatrophihabitans sp.]|uniref:hypothetical protein n=1 Tax=uncultured Jatrophihabitans sp. TaxID=1610747 RepID=UPI0035CC414D
MQLVVVTDRTSNGPQLLFPTPQAKGGAPTLFHWVLDNVDRDPWAEAGMLHAGGSTAARMGVTNSELDELKIMRHEQYEHALANDRAIQRRYLVPVEIERPQHGVHHEGMHLDADHGVRPLDPMKLRKMSPADPAGLHSYAAQTFPADGCAGALQALGAAGLDLADVDAVTTHNPFAVHDLYSRRDGLPARADECVRVQPGLRPAPRAWRHRDR